MCLCAGIFRIVGRPEHAFRRSAVSRFLTAFFFDEDVVDKHFRYIFGIFFIQHTFPI